MVRRLVRLAVVFWCAAWTAWIPVGNAYAATYPTRVVGGVHVIAGPSMAEVVNAIGSRITRVMPWVGAVTLGMELAKLVIQTDQGEMAVTTAGRAILDAINRDMGTETTSTYREAPTSWTTGRNATCQGPTTWTHAEGATATASCQAYPAVLNAYCAGVSGFVNYAYLSYNSGGNLCTIKQVPGGSGNEIGMNPVPNCRDGATFAYDGSGLCSAVSHTDGTPAPVKVTTEWSPSNFTDPSGTPQTGWQAPTDPNAQPLTQSPNDTFNYPEVNGATPQVQLTPRPDGGYTVSTYSPEFTTTGGVTTQTGWTVQTVTVNNGGTVTNVTIVNNNQSGPPNPATRPPVNPDPSGGPNPHPNPPQELNCDPISCESTQQQVRANTEAIKTELEAASAPTLPDQAAALTAAKAADKAESDAISGAIVVDESHWFSWVWTPPTGTCSAPHVNVGGHDVTVDYCPAVDMARDVLGWLFAILASWHCYGVLFRREG